MPPPAIFPQPLHPQTPPQPAGLWASRAPRRESGEGALSWVSRAVSLGESLPASGPQLPLLPNGWGHGRVSPVDSDPLSACARGTPEPWLPVCRLSWLLGPVQQGSGRGFNHENSVEGKDLEKPFAAQFSAQLDKAAGSSSFFLGTPRWQGRPVSHGKVGRGTSAAPRWGDRAMHQSRTAGSLGSVPAQPTARWVAWPSPCPGPPGWHRAGLISPTPTSCPNWPCPRRGLTPGGLPSGA